MKLIHLAFATALVFTPAALLAQVAPTAPVAPVTAAAPVNVGTIAERKQDQQQRIAQGVHSGQLTRGETRHLEAREHGINREERAMRSLDHGHLTKADKRTLTKQQNVTSRQIYKKKHNAKVR